jgi:hypothetical protein
MMKLNRTHFLLFLFPAFLVFACTKIDSTSLGQDLIPPVDNVNTFATDTFTIVTENTLFTDTSFLGKTDDYSLGVISADPVFGSTRANIYTELKPAFQFVWKAHRDSIISLPNQGYDSAFLCLGLSAADIYKGVYGDSTVPMTFEVVPITNNTSFKKDSLYRITSDPGTTMALGAPLGTITIKPQDINNQNFYVLKRDTTRYNNMLRIKFNNGAGQTYIKNMLSKDTSDAFKNDTTFRNEFKGFAIRPVGGGQAMMKFALTSSLTRLEIWYRYKKAGGQDTTFDSFGFVPNSGSPYRCASANYIARNLAGAQAVPYFAPGADSLVFIQTTPGTYATVRIPFIKNFPNKMIHRAELIFTESAPYVSPVLTPPYSIYLDAIDTPDRKFRTVPFDFYFTSLTSGEPDYGYFGGTLVNTTDNTGNPVGQYKFNITKYMQGMITRNDRYYDLRLYCPYSTRFYSQDIPGFPWPLINPPVFGRVVLGGGTHNTAKVKLRVIYSNL